MVIGVVPIPTKVALIEVREVPNEIFQVILLQQFDEFVVFVRCVSGVLKILFVEIQFVVLVSGDFLSKKL